MKEPSVRDQPIRAVATLLALCILVGCGGGGGSTLLADKSVLEFGASKLNEVISVAPPAAGVNVAIRAEHECPWLTVNPQQAFSTGPDAKATFTVSVVRAWMNPGTNTCSIRLRAPGYDDTTVHVRADAILSADFRVAPASAREGEPVVFSDATRVLPGSTLVTTWKWDFGDGATSLEQNPVHTYASPGVYTVSLSVKSETASDVRVVPNCITVRRPAAPRADFVAATRRPPVGIPVQFEDLSLPGATELRAWRWDFGDGGSSFEQNPTHIYRAAAVYDVYLTVENRHGRDTAVKYGYIDVRPAPPE